MDPTFINSTKKPHDFIGEPDEEEEENQSTTDLSPSAQRGHLERLKDDKFGSVTSV